MHLEEYLEEYPSRANVFRRVTDHQAPPKPARTRWLVASRPLVSPFVPWPRISMRPEGPQCWDLVQSTCNLTQHDPIPSAWDRFIRLRLRRKFSEPAGAIPLRKRLTSIITQFPSAQDPNDRSLLAMMRSSLFIGYPTDYRKPTCSCTRSLPTSPNLASRL